MCSCDDHDGSGWGGRVWKRGEAAVETVSEGSGVVRLLEKEPTKAERYAHAAALLAIIQRTGTPHEPPQQLHRVAATTA
jgi:hypothetical protein